MSEREGPYKAIENEVRGGGAVGVFATTREAREVASMMNAVYERGFSAGLERAAKICEKTILFREIDIVETNVEAMKRQLASMFRELIRQPQQETNDGRE